jgi:hypothetical protein
VWSVVSGTTPLGLTLASNGSITGTPTTVAQTSFTVQVADSTPVASENALATVTINVAAPSIRTSFLSN